MALSYFLVVNSPATQRVTIDITKSLTKITQSSDKICLEKLTCTWCVSCDIHNMFITKLIWEQQEICMFMKFTIILSMLYSEKIWFLQTIIGSNKWFQYTCSVKTMTSSLSLAMISALKLKAFRISFQIEVKCCIKSKKD